MRQEPCEAHGSIFPADAVLVERINAVMRDWNLSECAELEGDFLRIAFVGVCFPLDDILAALKPYVHEATPECPALSGKIDVFDLEDWRLTRALILDSEVRVSSSHLNDVLAYSGF